MPVLTNLTTRTATPTLSSFRANVESFHSHSAIASPTAVTPLKNGVQSRFAHII
ncbi:MAG: hypothetical protein K0U45_01260 [Alphaproteobacteria bacterium]|nr:hypothetical protein [Alphaproteobacteria bacterium]